MSAIAVHAASVARTAADAGILTGFCAAVWLLMIPFVSRRGWFGKLLLYVFGAAATTGAALAIGRWREHVRLTGPTASVIAGGMAVFWILVALQSRRPWAGTGSATARATGSPEAKGAPIAATQSAGLSTGGPDIEIDLVRAEAADRAASTGPAVMTRRERRLASRRRFALGHRRSQRVM